MRPYINLTSINVTKRKRTISKISYVVTFVIIMVYHIFIFEKYPSCNMIQKETIIYNVNSYKKQHGS